MRILQSRRARRMVFDYVWQKVADAQDDNIVALGTGVGIKGDEIDLERPYCVRFYVKKKVGKGRRKRQQPKLAVGSEMKLPLRMFGPGETDQHDRVVRDAWLECPTDVYEIGELEAAGWRASLDRDPSLVTCGAILRWRIRGDSAPLWGIATVAHGYEQAIHAAPSTDITVSLPRADLRFRGKRLLQFKPPDSGFDLCLIGVNPERLVALGLITSVNVRPRTVRRFSQLTGDSHSVGLARQIGRDINFQVLGTVEGPLFFSRVGTVRDLLHVRGPRNAFVGGTSGSVFEVLNRRRGRLEIAGIQVGTDTRNGFRDGFAQSLERSLVLLRRRLNEQLLSAGLEIPGKLEVVGVI